MKNRISIALLAIVLSACGQSADDEVVQQEQKKAEQAKLVGSTQELANKGEAEAQFKMAEIYYNGDDATQDIDQARDWYLKAAKQGHAKAQYKLGLMYYRGEGVEPDNIKAYEWLLRAAHQDVAEAQYAMGQMFKNGDGVVQSDSKSFQWFQKSAKLGFADAQYNLALDYKNGVGTDSDLKLAKYWFVKACDTGNEQSCDASQKININIDDLADEEVITQESTERMDATVPNHSNSLNTQRALTPAVVANNTYKKPVKSYASSKSKSIEKKKTNKNYQNKTAKSHTNNDYETADKNSTHTINELEQLGIPPAQSPANTNPTSRETATKSNVNEPVTSTDNVVNQPTIPADNNKVVNNRAPKNTPVESEEPYLMQPQDNNE